MADATEYSPAPFSVKSLADHTANQHHFMKLSSGAPVLCDTQGERSIGIMSSAPNVGQGATIHKTPGEVVPVRVGTNGVTADAAITPDANGEAEDAATGDVTAFVALKTGAAGELVPALCIHEYTVP